MENLESLGGLTTDDLRQSLASSSDLPRSSSDGTTHGCTTHGIDEPPIDSPVKATIRVGLIDRLLFSRDCLIRAFAIGNPDLEIIPFDSVKRALEACQGDLDVILYHCHDDNSVEMLALRQIAALRQAYPNTPLVVLSDAQSAVHPKSIRNALNSGAHGFIPTSTTEVPAALAAIRFVKEGGTFAPLNLLLGGRPEQNDATQEQSRGTRLTPRQTVVLSLLQQGKANKIIAYELGMTESTVKVHIRNIMRKMGATNRTQAVYYSQQLGNMAYSSALGE